MRDLGWVGRMQAEGHGVWDEELEFGTTQGGTCAYKKYLYRGADRGDLPPRLSRATPEFVQMNFWNAQEPTIKGVNHHPRLSDSDRRGLVLDTFGSAVARIPVHERPTFSSGWQGEGVAILQPSAAIFQRPPGGRYPESW